MKKHNKILWARSMLIIILVLNLLAFDKFISKQGWFRKACYSLMLDGVKWRMRNWYN